MHSLRGSEPTALEAVGCEWRYALLVVQARNDDDDDFIGSTLGKLSRVLSRIR